MVVSGEVLIDELSELGLIQTDFLKSGKYWPYCKPDNQILYINAGSNHPPMIKNQLPSMLSKRLSELSCNREEFAKAAIPYNIAIKTSGYRGGLVTTTMLQISRKKKKLLVQYNIVQFSL